MSNIDNTLKERGDRYGSYENQTAISQGMQRVMQNTPNWDDLPDYMKDFLQMTAVKVSRILNGDPTYLDNLIDIIGYATLAKELMEQHSDLDRLGEKVDQI